LADKEEIFVVDLNTNAVAAYGGGSKMSDQIQAVEALKALELVERSGSSEAQVQERVARRTESVIVTISPEARALRVADAQSGAEAPKVAAQAVRTELASIAQTAEPAIAAPVIAADIQVEPADPIPVAAPVVQAEPDSLDQITATPVAPTAEAPQIETADADAGTMAPETTEQTTPEEAIAPIAVQVARPEQADAVDDGEELAQRAAADAATAAESTDGDASDVQPI
jgi:hypothetical protein